MYALINGIHMARNTKEKALETRGNILDAAEDVFYDKGVSNTSLNDVAAAAGVTRGAIYWHFKNKADLFDAMCRRVRDPMLTMIEEMADEKTEDPLGQLRKGGDFVMQQVVDNPHYRKVLTILFHKCEYLDDNDPILIRQKDWLGHGMNTIRRVMENAKSKGQLADDIDINLASVMLRVTFDGLLNNWLFMPDNFDLVADSARIRMAVIDSLLLHPALRTGFKFEV
jgi:TetR/AcrR family acrAB operon transcriptional repressor